MVSLPVEYGRNISPIHSKCGINQGLIKRGIFKNKETWESRAAGA
jgi:hypothetical protein